MRIPSLAVRAVPSSVARMPTARAQPRTDSFARATTASRAVAAATPADAAQMVGNAYRTFLRREAEPEGLALWTTEAAARASAGATAPELAAWLETEFKACPELAALALVDRKFAEVLGRPVDGRGYWHEQAVAQHRDGGQSLGEVEAFLETSLKNSDEYKLAHVDATVSAAFEEVLGRPSEGGYWHDVARELIGAGKSLDEIGASLRESFRQSEEYKLGQVSSLVDAAFEEVLGHPSGGEGYWHDVARQMVSEGSPLDEISAYLKTSFQQSDEYQLAHLDQLVGSIYQDLLQREADPQGLAHWTALAEGMKGEGKMPAEIYGWISGKIMESSEYAALHAPPPPARNSNRDEIYVQQPNNWTCGPTSLTMALAAFGVRSPTHATVWDMVAQTGTNASIGLPGSAALIAQTARNNGLQAEYSSSRSSDDVRAALESGKGAVVNGTTPFGTPHFIYLAGIDAQGRFIVCDPFYPGQTRYSDADLYAFTHRGSNPPGFAAVWK